MENYRRQQKLYSFKEVDNLIERYIKAGGEAVQTDEGVLGSGNWVLFDTTGKLRSFVINEVYLNEWSSAHTIRGYKKLPKKHEALLEKCC